MRHTFLDHFCHPEGVKSILVDGGWSEDDGLSSCSSTCERQIIRECNNPIPCGGGSDCIGRSTTHECCENCTGMILLGKQI